MPKFLDKLREKLSTGDEESEVEEVEEIEPNSLEADVISGSGLEVNELADKIVKGKNISKVDVLRGIYRAIDEGKVQLIDPNPPRNFIEYLKVSYSGWFWLVVVFSALLFFSVYLMPQIYPLVYLRYAAGAIYILYVPGFTLIEALYPKKNELERLERFALGVGLSLALVPLVGLVLNYTPWGIRLDPIFASLGILTTTLGLFGVYRKFNYWKLSHEFKGRLK
jgi:hypothetical protein